MGECYRGRAPGPGRGVGQAGPQLDDVAGDMDDVAA